MEPAIKVALVVVPAIGGGTPAGAYVFTRESVESQKDIRDNVLPQDLTTGSDSPWKTKEDILKGTNPNPSPSSEEFKELKTKLSSNNSNDGSQLKAECLSSYSKDYKSVFTSERTLLRDDVKNFCILKIGDKLEANKKINTNNGAGETDLKPKAKLIRSHEDSDANGRINDDTFLSELKELKGKTESEAENAWEKLKAWCKKVYERGYRGDKDNLWLLTNKYCKKS